MTTASIPAPDHAARPSPWFHSAPFDLLLVLGTPLVTWPLLLAAKGAVGPDLLRMLLPISATGHYFATFVRAYGDRELFARFRTRLTVAPVALAAIALGLIWNGQLAAVMLVTALWGFWHWLAQAFGFARIYDSKVGSYAARTALLDRALVVMGFVGTVILNPNSTALFGTLFLDVGIALPSAETFGLVQSVTETAVAGTALAYVGNLAATIARGQPWSWQKQCMHVTTIGYYWFAFSYAPNVLIAHVLYEVFHDIQYFAITWITCRARVRRDGVTPWLRTMFRPGPVAALLYIAAMAAFGGLDVLGRSLDRTDLLGQTSLGLFLAAAWLHYYYDGFLWKAREASLGSDLGIQRGLTAAVVPTARHALRWAWFAVPLALAVSASSRTFSDRERLTYLAGVAPSDFLTRSQLAFEEIKMGRLPEAEVHARASVESNPEYAPARLYLGVALEAADDAEGARTQYEAALAVSDDAGAHALAHTNLAAILFVAGERDRAETHARAAQTLGGPPVVQRLFELGRYEPSTTGHRIRAYETILVLDPRALHALYELGRLLLDAGDAAGAERRFQALVDQDPSPDPLVALAEAKLALGQSAAARQLVKRALGAAPGHPAATVLRSRLGR
jgi:tetratricopeptide (TPR) repeat protein